MSPFDTDERSITWRHSGETLRVETWGADSVRVRAVPAGDLGEELWALLPPEPATSPTPAVEVGEATATLRHGQITVRMDAAEWWDAQAQHEVGSCSLTFMDATGTVLLREIGDGGSLKLKARSWRPLVGAATHHLTASFTADPTEHLAGMGQYQQSILDIKGSTFELAHRNSQASVPYFTSSAGYGFLWNNPAIGRATFASNRTEFVAEATRGLDYWVTAGATPTDLAAAYARATGHAPVMPEHGLGYWQCKLRYWNQEQLLEVAREHHRRGIPLDVIVADFFHWPKMGDYRFEEEFWPDPKAMVNELADLRVELMVSVWPQVSTGSENYAAFRRDNHLVRVERGLDVQMSFEGPSAFVDTTNPAARARLWELCRRNYYDYGIRTFWLDEAEPEYAVYDFDNFRYHLGSNLEVGNIYPQLFSRAFWDGQQEEGQDQVVNLVRCAWAGSQRYGALVWSGDISSTFEDLRAQIVAGVHMGVAGIPWFTTDIGGFHHGDVTDPAFHELLVRWFQFGTFCPVMRMHGDRKPTHDVTAADGTRRLGSGADNEVWSFGPEVEAVLVRHIHFRERMRECTRAAMTAAHESGQPVMRGLFHEFPDDAQTWSVADQYLFGPDLLVAPVVELGARSRPVYLPAGAQWTDLHTGTTHPGGQWVQADAPLELMPVFTRDGAWPELVGQLLADDTH